MSDPNGAVGPLLGVGSRWSMAAAEDGEALAPKAGAGRGASAELLVVLAVAAGFALTVLVFYPG